MIQPGCSTSSSSNANISFDSVDLPEILSPLCSSTSTSTSTPSTSQPKPPPPSHHNHHQHLFSKGRVERPTECLICGNPANGFHYDVASCNGCKTFFRRVCLSEKTFTCKINGDCYDLTKRKTYLKCRACRHQKCIAVGMNPLAMEVDEKEALSTNFKKLMKRTIIKEEEPDEDDDCQIVEEVQNCPQNGPQNSKQVIKMVDSMENKLQKVIDVLVYLEVKVEQFRKSSYNPHWQDLKGLVHLLETESRISYADRYGPMPGWPLQKHQMKRPPPPAPGLFTGPKHDPERKQWFFYNLMTTVEYAKTFMFFHKLSSQDKLILARYTTLACMNLHVSYSSMVKKFDVPVHPDGSHSPFRDGEHYTAMVMSVAPLIRCQIRSVEYLLLKAICLCNPAVPDLSHHAQDVISTERELYANALLDHCLRNRSDGPAHFAQLIQIIDVLERQQRMQKDLHLLQVAPRLAKLPKEYVIRVIEDIMDC